MLKYYFWKFLSFLFDINWIPGVMIELVLGVFDAASGPKNVSINTEIWNSITSWVNFSFSCLEISIKIFLMCLLRLRNWIFGINDIGVNSKIWNFIVYWPIWFSPSWLLDLLIPWHTPWNWSKFTRLFNFNSSTSWG